MGRRGADEPSAWCGVVRIQDIWQAHKMDEVCDSMEYDYIYNIHTNIYIYIIIYIYIYKVTIYLYIKYVCIYIYIHRTHQLDIIFGLV